MAEESKHTGGSTTSTVMILAVVLIAILAVFMVTSLNTMKNQLVELNRKMETLSTTTAQNSLGTYQAVDEEGNVVMRFQPVPMEMMGEEQMMMEEAQNQGAE